MQIEVFDRDSNAVGVLRAPDAPLEGDTILIRAIGDENKEWRVIRRKWIELSDGELVAQLIVTEVVGNAGATYQDFGFSQRERIDALRVWDVSDSAMIGGGSGGVLHSVFQANERALIMGVPKDLFDAEGQLAVDEDEFQDRLVGVVKDAMTVHEDAFRHGR